MLLLDLYHTIFSLVIIPILVFKVQNYLDFFVRNEALLIEIVQFLIRFTT